MSLVGVQAVHSPFVFGVLYSRSRELLSWGKTGEGSWWDLILGWYGPYKGKGLCHLTIFHRPCGVLNHYIVHRSKAGNVPITQENYPNSIMLWNSLSTWIYHRFTSKLLLFLTCSQKGSHLLTKRHRIIGTLWWCDSWFRVDSYSSFKKGTTLKCSLNMAPFHPCTTFHLSVLPSWIRLSMTTNNIQHRNQSMSWWQDWRRASPVPFAGTVCSLCSNGELEHLPNKTTTSGTLKEWQDCCHFDKQLSERQKLSCVVFYFRQRFRLNQANHSARRPQNHKCMLVRLHAFVLPFPWLSCKSYNDNHM